MIFQSDDQFGPIQVIDDGMVRSLHFDAIEKQSAMDLERPEDLILSYTRFMMAGFLFNPEASQILCIGLGGGSIPRFLMHHLQQCRIDIVEIRPKVIEIAYTYFLLPTDHRIRCFQEDGTDFVSKSTATSYDMILVDAYDQNGLAEGVIRDRFIESCIARLQPTGIFCINLWSHPQSTYRKAIKSISTLFDANLAEIPVKERTNRIVLGLKADCRLPSLPTLKKRSQLLEARLKLPFPGMLDILVKNNPLLFKN